MGTVVVVGGGQLTSDIRRHSESADPYGETRGVLSQSQLAVAQWCSWCRGFVSSGRHRAGHSARLGWLSARDTLQVSSQATKNAEAPDTTRATCTTWGAAGCNPDQHPLTANAVVCSCRLLSLLHADGLFAQSAEPHPVGHFGVRESPSPKLVALAYPHELIWP